MRKSLIHVFYHLNTLLHISYHHSMYIYLSLSFNYSPNLQRTTFHLTNSKNLTHGYYYLQRILHKFAPQATWISQDLPSSNRHNSLCRMNHQAKIQYLNRFVFLLSIIRCISLRSNDDTLRFRGICHFSIPQCKHPHQNKLKDLFLQQHLFKANRILE